jgi:hypothetical protein
MNRSVLKLLGMMLFLVFGFMAATPTLAAHTSVFGAHNFNVTVGTITLVSVTHDVHGSAIGSASMITAILAVLGVAMMAAVFALAPVHKNRYIVSGR